MSGLVGQCAEHLNEECNEHLIEWHTEYLNDRCNEHLIKRHTEHLNEQCNEHLIGRQTERLIKQRCSKERNRERLGSALGSATKTKDGIGQGALG